MSHMSDLDILRRDPSAEFTAEQGKIVRDYQEARGHWPHPEGCGCEWCARGGEPAELLELRSHAAERMRPADPILGGCPCEVCEATRKAIARLWRMPGESSDPDDVSDEPFSRFFTA